VLAHPVTAKATTAAAMGWRNRTMKNPLVSPITTNEDRFGNALT